MKSRGTPSWNEQGKLARKLGVPPPPRAATAELEMRFVHDASHGIGTSITRRPRELPGREPGGFVPNTRFETGIKFGKLPLKAGLAFARNVCLRLKGLLEN